MFSRSLAEALSKAAQPNSLKQPPKPSTVWKVFFGQRLIWGAGSGSVGLHEVAVISCQGRSAVLLIQVTDAAETPEVETTQELKQAIKKSPSLTADMA